MSYIWIFRTIVLGGVNLGESLSPPHLQLVGNVCLCIFLRMKNLLKVEKFSLTEVLHADVRSGICGSREFRGGPMGPTFFIGTWKPSACRRSYR